MPATQPSIIMKMLDTAEELLFQLKMFFRRLWHYVLMLGYALVVASMLTILITFLTDMFFFTVPLRKVFMITFAVVVISLGFLLFIFRDRDSKKVRAAKFLSKLLSSSITRYEAAVGAVPLAGNEFADVFSDPEYIAAKQEKNLSKLAFALQAYRDEVVATQQAYIAAFNEYLERGSSLRWIAETVLSSAARIISEQGLTVASFEIPGKLRSAPPAPYPKQLKSESIDSRLRGFSSAVGVVISRASSQDWRLAAAAFVVGMGAQHYLGSKYLRQLEELEGELLLLGTAVRSQRSLVQHLPDTKGPMILGLLCETLKRVNELKCALQPEEEAATPSLASREALEHQLAFEIKKGRILLQASRDG
jgi:hypothetical protein